MKKISTFFKPVVQDNGSEKPCEKPCENPTEKEQRTTSSVASSGPKPRTSSLDIGCLSDKELKHDKIKASILQDQWIPEATFKFPYHAKGGKKRKFNPELLKKYPWMRYSFEKDGVYCAYCALFGTCKARTKFVSDPVTDWVNVHKLIKQHVKEGSDHFSAADRASHFLQNYSGETQDICSFASAAYRDKVTRNRHILGVIIRTLILCGKRNIPLRARNNDDSNFVALLHHPAYADPILADHLSHDSPGECRYLSPKIQNELLDICAAQIRESLVSGCNNAQCFTIIADETTDVSTKEQLSVSVRFVHRDQNQMLCLREKFLGFLEASSTKGRYIAQLLLSALDDFGIDAGKMRGQGYDGAANMKGKFNGVQAVIRETHPHSNYVHCQSHCLNLAIVHSCNIKTIRNLMTATQNVGFAFHYSAKRQNRFSEFLASDPTTKEAMGRRTKLQQLCDTRWASRADSLYTLKASFSLVCRTLEDLEDEDPKARDIRKGMEDFDFIVALVVAEHILQFTVMLSKHLQAVDADLIQATTEAANVVATLRDERADEAVWEELYTQALDLAAEVNVQEYMPRIAGKQLHRDNAPAATPKDYWRINLYYQFSDHLITELELRLLQPKPLMQAQSLLPAKLHALPEPPTAVFEPFQVDIAPEAQAQQAHEIRRWKQHWANTKEKPKTIIETLQLTNPDLYPSVWVALVTLLTLPVSTATAERSFNSLRRVKTYLRNTMTEGRLNALTLLHIYKDFEINIDDVIDTFAGSGTRRISLLF